MSLIPKGGPGRTLFLVLIPLASAEILVLALSSEPVDGF